MVRRGLGWLDEAADAMVKAANGRFIGKVHVGGGLVTVMAATSAVKAGRGGGAAQTRGRTGQRTSSPGRMMTWKAFCHHRVTRHEKIINTAERFIPEMPFSAGHLRRPSR